MSPNTPHRPQEPPSWDTVRAPDGRRLHCTADRGSGFAVRELLMIVSFIGLVLVVYAMIAPVPYSISTYGAV